jgi:putative membrane protein
MARTARKILLAGVPVIAAVILGTAAPARAAQSGVNGAGTGVSSAPDKGDPGSTLTPRDRELVDGMARAGLAEIELGRLAAAKASDLAVKQFGEQMVEEHGKANETLEEIAAAKGVSLPTEPSSQQQREIAELAKLSGVEFDRRYMERAAKKDHPEAQRLFEDAATTAEDEDVKKFAEAQIKVAGRHIEMARSVGHSAGNLAPSRDGEAPFREPRAGAES